MVVPSTPPESRFVHGVLEMCVLSVIDETPLHAYGIVQRLHDLGFASAGYGTIYPLVTRLRRQGLVDQQVVPSDSGPARNVLAINDAGRAALRAWVRQWRQTTDAVTAVLDRGARRDSHVG